MAGKPILSVSLDLDNQWAYLKARGTPGWDSYPSYLPEIVPRILGFLRRRELKITVFIVGKDAEMPAHREALEAIARDGHEIGNHGYSHEPWLAPHDVAALEREVERAEEAIVAATGLRPVGYRGAGFQCAPALLRLLAARGYAYDASLFPTSLGPLARWYYFASAKMTAEEKRLRRRMFGLPRAWRLPLQGFRWVDGGRHGLFEIPVTTMPGSRFPMHFSYVMTLGRRSVTVARGYLGAGLWCCRAFGVAPSLLLHPLDFMGEDDAPALRFFPGMRQTAARKLRLLEGVFDGIQRRFQPAPLREHARRLEESESIRLVEISSLESGSP